MSWIRELKAGDEFLSQSNTFLGVVVELSNNRLRWDWYFIKTGIHYRQDVADMDSLEKFDYHLHWTKLTPLLKELL